MRGFGIKNADLGWLCFASRAKLNKCSPRTLGLNFHPRRWVRFDFPLTFYFVFTVRASFPLRKNHSPLQLGRVHRSRKAKSGPGTGRSLNLRRQDRARHCLQRHLAQTRVLAVGLGEAVLEMIGEVIGAHCRAEMSFWCIGPDLRCVL